MRIIILLFLFSSQLKAQQVAIELPQMNVLYVGLDNPVSIAIEGISKEKICARGDNVKLIEKLDGQYIAIVELSSNRKALISVGYLKGSDTIWCRTANYRIKTIPTPDIRMGGLNSGCYPRTQVLAQFNVLAYFEGFVFDGVSAKIDSVQLIVSGLQGAYHYSIVGGKIPASAYSAIRSAFFIRFYSAHVSVRQNKFLISEPLDIYIKDEFGECPYRVEPSLNNNGIQTIFYVRQHKYTVIEEPKEQKDKIVRNIRCFRMDSSQTLISQRIMADSICLAALEWYRKGYSKETIAFPDFGTRTDTIGNYFSYFENGNFKHVGEVIRPDYAPNFVPSVPDKVRFRSLYYGDSSEYPYVRIGQIIPHGEWKEYYENGILRSVGAYSHYYGPDNGEIIDWSKDNLKYLYVIRVGYWKFYDAEGKLKLEIKYGKSGEELKRTEY